MDIPPVARAQCGAFTAAQAGAAQWTRSQIAHAVRVGRLIRTQPGVYVDATFVEAEGLVGDQRRLVALASAAALATSGSAVSHRSAALLAGLPVLTVPSRPCLTVPPRRTGDARHAHLHRATLTAPDLHRTGAVRRTSLVRTICDIARENGVEEAAVVADAALHQGRVEMGSLEAAGQRFSCWPGQPRIARAVSLVDGRAESPLETLSRLRLRDTGLPPGEPQVNIHDLSGRWLARVDFLWEEFGVVGEVDGASKYDGTDYRPLLEEKRRQERLEQAGLIVIRWDFAELQRLAGLTERLRQAFVRGRRRPPSERCWLAVRDHLV